MILLLFILAFPAFAQTLAEPSQIKQWSQVDIDGCVSVQPVAGGFTMVRVRVAPAPGGTRLQVSQIRKPANQTGDCWPLDLKTAARAVINTHCTRCHGNDLRPGDVSLVGGLDLRTREAMLIGGNRGPALKPYDLYGSLIFLYASRCQVCSLTTTMGPGPLPPLRELQTDAINAGFAFIPPDSNEWSVGMPPFWQIPEFELAALRDWILAGAP